MKMLLQQFLLQEALNEYDIEGLEIKIDHKNGKSFIGNCVLGIKYPKYFLKNISNLSHKKIYDYCFIGSTTDGLGRKEIIEKYYQYNSKIEHSSNGRDPDIKFRFDTNYYQIMANSYFGLCPGHPAMPKHPNRWTYRFIESAFCKAIPVQFKETIYGDSFVRDIFFVWDQDIPVTINDYDRIVEDNYIKAIKYWTLQPEEINEIKKNS